MPFAIRGVAVPEGCALHRHSLTVAKEPEAAFGRYQKSFPTDGLR